MLASAAKLNSEEREEPEPDNKCRMSCIHGAWTQNVFCRHFLDYRSIVAFLALATTVVILRIYVGKTIVEDVNISVVTEPLHGDLKVTMGVTAGHKNLMDLYIDDAIGLRTHLGESIPEYKGRPVSCSSRDKEYCWLWESDLRLEIHQDPNMDSCQVVSWWSDNTLANLTDCFELGNWNWYGVGNPVWPLQRTGLNGISATTGGWLDRTSIMERYWITSAGVAIKAADDVPLFLNLDALTNELKANNSRRLCLTAHYAPPYRHSYPGAPVLLRYHICYGLNLTDVFLKTRNYFFRKPTGFPDERMILKPVWSTWVRYKNQTNSSFIVDFANEIVENNFTTNSQLEIDNQWEACFGDHYFDHRKFPDPQGMVNRLKDLGFRMNLWIHPFVSPDCISYNEAKIKSYLVKNLEGQPGTTNWWHGKAGIVDMTNPAAMTWFKRRLQNIIDEYGFDSFNFDAGEANWLPHDFVMSGAAEHQPNIYSTSYAAMAATFGNLTEIRIGRRTQHLPIFVRLIHRDSNWGNTTTTGIKSIIPTVLQYGLLGYPFVMPDIVGGNAYNGFPNRELYIRWVELNTFLPCIRFSIVPWQYDNEVVRITRKMLAIRSKYSDLLLKTARQGMMKGTPMIRPLWWIDPLDYQAQTIDTQFLVGEDILVAPVLDRGVQGRDIFFPKGKWKSTKDGMIYSGPLWVMHYPVPLDELAYFEKIYD